MDINTMNFINSEIRQGKINVEFTDWGKDNPHISFYKKDWRVYLPISCADVEFLNKSYLDLIQYENFAEVKEELLLYKKKIDNLLNKLESEGK